MSERLWSYTELRLAYIKSRQEGPEQAASFLNQKFHDGEGVRSAQDVERVLEQHPIFARPKKHKPRMDLHNHRTIM
ncbi:MAG: hypothetical protein GF334_09755 [Candidatus Altiarchaeales archaeon]|nr:hypothetical protein [Candidatus Altiarchaeales archaeon]